MKRLMIKIQDVLAEAFEKAGYDGSLARVSVSNRPDLCEFQCNGAMAAAKRYKKAPMVIAQDVVGALPEQPPFKAEIAAPGFLNLTVEPAFLAEYLNEAAKDGNFGIPQAEKRRIVLDYGGPNVAKPLHVGHLRSAVIGESVQRLARYMGHKVISDVHLGDWGLQMGLIITELQERQPGLVYFDPDYSGEFPAEPPFPISELEEIYPAASRKSKEDEAFAERAHQATLKLQQGYAPYRALWRHIMNVSLADLRRNYDNLNVHFDLWKGESDADPYIPALIQEFIDKGLAYESNGALVVDIAEPGDSREYPPCIIRKSDGAALYATSDLATLVQREKDYRPDRYIYVVDKRQELHFIQVFRAAKKAGIVPEETKMIFLGFGTMNGKDGGPFKTREGGVMRLEYLLRDINEAVCEKIREKDKVPEEEIEETSRKVALAAIKYGDLSNQATKDYIFDVERFTSFEGNTGPHIQYMVVRIKSILSRYAEEKGSLPELVIRPASGDSEKKLMLSLCRFGETIEAAFSETAPHRVCQFMAECADAFNDFYLENKILSEPDEERKAGFISLIRLTGMILDTCMDLLGMESPEHM